MSTPEPPQEPQAAAEDQTAQLPPSPPAPPPAPRSAAVPPQMYAGGPNPWTAPPREYWINPSRRVPALIAAIVAALVLLTVGGFIGAAVHGHNEHDRVMFVPGYRNGPVNGPFGPSERLIPPGRAKLPQPVTPTPTPTKT